MQKNEFNIIGTHLAINIETQEDCSQVFAEIQDRLTQFESHYSRFIEDNWLHLLNKNRVATLDNDGQKMLNCMLDISRRTDGYFDPTVGKRLSELGYGNQKIDMLHLQDKGFGDYRDIEMNGDQVILHGDILLEFGGIGKGYLIDILKSKLDIYPRFLINFGGDMYGRGSWQIGLESPFASDEVVGTLILEDHFLACSAGTRRKWGSHHHLIDPHTGVSSYEVVASYIEGKSGMITDAYATVLCVMPWEKAIQTLEKTPEISGVIVSALGDIYQKKGSRIEVFSS